jgi:hypothetical protein
MADIANTKSPKRSNENEKENNARSRCYYKNSNMNNFSTDTKIKPRALLDRLEIDSSLSFMPLKSDKFEKEKKLFVDSLDTTTIKLNKLEIELISKLKYAFYNARKTVSVNFNISSDIDSVPTFIRTALPQSLLSTHITSFMLAPIKRVLAFSKLIVDFRSLNLKDQTNLLIEGGLEIIVCSSSTLYNTYENNMRNMLGKEQYHVEGNNDSRIQLEVMRKVWSEEVFERTIRFLKSMSDLELDEATVILLLPLILFAPDRRELKERRRVYQLQAKYSHILRKYLYWKHEISCRSNADKLYSQLLLKLVELRNLNEMHANILLDAEPTKLESLPKAVILNKKDESDMVNSVKTNLAENCKPSLPYASDLGSNSSQPMSNASLLDHAAQKSSDSFSTTSSSVPSTPASSFHIPSVSMDSE